MLKPIVMEEFALPAGRVEVLIVDDDGMASFLHGKILKRVGIKNVPLFFLNGKLAFEHIEGHPKADTSFLVFLDLNMPVLDGWGFLDKCSEAEMSKVFVVILTSSVSESDFFRALNYKQVMGFSRKPVTLDILKDLMDFPTIKELFIEMEYEALENGNWDLFCRRS